MTEILQSHLKISNIYNKKTRKYLERLRKQNYRMDSPE